MVAVRPPESPSALPPHTHVPEAGVIEDARARQRRHRAAGATAVAILAAALALGLAGGSTTTPRSLPAVRLSAAPTWLRGVPLTGASTLHLVASENGGTVFVVDVDHHSAHALPGLGFPPQALPAVDLSAAPGGAVAVVSTPTCVSCAIRETQTDFLIGANGAVRRVGRVTLTRHQYTTTQALNSTATWVLTWPTGGRCTLRLEPSPRPAVPVPCGSLGSDTPAGLLVGSGAHELVLDPLTGSIREHISVSGPLVVLQNDLALTSTDPGFPGDSSFPANLTLVNLATGSRKRLAWPSILHFGYRVLPEPHRSLAAIEFVDPAYTPGENTIGQAADIWMLDPHTARFTHVPGFPILESVKQSAVAWTADDRLAIVAQGGALTQPQARTVIGLWRPGQRTIHLRSLPPLNGYSQFVPLAG